MGRSTCKVSWRDEDCDDVTIESDEELLIALQELNGPVYKLQVVKGSGLLPEVGQSQETSKTNNNKGEEHFGVTCDSCDGSINGFRYKCMVKDISYKNDIAIDILPKFSHFCTLL